jgi:hypothetical protein
LTQRLFIPFVLTSVKHAGLPIPGQLAEIEQSIITTRLTIFMRQHISAELKKVALRLAVVRGYKYKKIRKITGISERTTQHVQALHWCMGDVATS